MTDVSETVEEYLWGRRYNLLYEVQLSALYHRKPDDGGFKYVKGHQLLDQFVGNSEKAVKALFDDARKWREQKGYPAVLFFDEADALFKRRPSTGLEGAFTLVPALLAEMDGMA